MPAAEGIEQAEEALAGTVKAVATPAAWRASAMSRPTVLGSTGTAGSGGGAASALSAEPRPSGAADSSVAGTGSGGASMAGLGRRPGPRVRRRLAASTGRSTSASGPGLGGLDLGLDRRFDGRRLHGRLRWRPFPVADSNALTVVLELEGDGLVETAEPRDDPLEVVLALARDADRVALDL